MRPNIAPNFVCQKHCMNTGLESKPDLGILGISLKGKMCMKESWWIDSGEWKCSGIREGIGLTLLYMANIMSESAMYAENCMWG